VAQTIPIFCETPFLGNLHFRESLEIFCGERILSAELNLQPLDD
jgi:hypothetical protein